MRTPTVFLVTSAVCLLCCEARAGYTHYFTWHQPPGEAALRSCVAEMRLIVEARKSMLAAPDEPGSPPGSPAVGLLSVDLNGIGEDAHEPFIFPGGSGFNFCKTEGKPYDEVVTACLLVARDHFPPSVLSISSDGSWNDWSAGANLYTSVLGRPARDPMGEPWAGVRSPSILVPLFAAALIFIAVVYWLKKKMGTL